MLKSIILCKGESFKGDGNNETFPIRVWNRVDGSLLHSFTGHNKNVNDLAVSPDGNYVASGGEDRIAILWEISSGKEIRLFDEHESSVQTIQFSPNGDSLLTGGFDCSVRYWDVSNGRVKFKWQLGKYDRLAESEWRIAQISESIKRASNSSYIPSVNSWNYPYISSIDFSPTGERAIVGLRIPSSLTSTTLLHHRSNPVVLDLISKEVSELPSEFSPLPSIHVWAAFNHDGSAGIFNRVRSERIRGENKIIKYLSVTGVP
ncbi:MAG: WD40 repeat domain-containing protein [Pirellulales bacterium]